MPEDRRTCVLCQQVGDKETNVASRLLNHDVDKWVHLNCALWSSEVCIINTVHKTQKSPACIPALTPGPDPLESDSGQIIKTHIKYKGEINWKTSRQNLLFSHFTRGSPPWLETALLYSQYALLLVWNFGKYYQSDSPVLIFTGL